MTRTLEPAPPGAAVASLTDSEFAAFQAFVYREAGIYLSQAKKALLMTRLLPRVRELGVSTFGDYFRRCRASADERQWMLDAVCTNETHFFREPAQFAFLVERLAPQWMSEAAAGVRRRRLRVWSAACSSGEEPYSLAMALLRALPGWSIEIVATDLSTKVLKRARNGIWPISKAAEIPEAMLHEYMRKGTGASEGLIRAGEDLRRVIHFSQLNLNDPDYGDIGTFDAIFCRNVLIYFDVASKDAVIRRLNRHLAGGGHLFLGHAESLQGNDLGLKSVIPNVYRRTEP